MSRLLGQETEYAIRFSPARGQPHPGNELLFEAFRHAIAQRVATRPGERNFFQEQFFTENGGAFCYEFLPYARQGGLLEGATPECSGAGELLLYQRAQESLLTEAIPRAEGYLRERGILGELGLIKNCRDHEGHLYGAQENYETRIGQGANLLCYRLGLALMFPILPVLFLVYWVYVLLILAAFFAVLLLLLMMYGAIRLLVLLLDHGVRLVPARQLAGMLGEFLDKSWLRIEGQLGGKRFESLISQMEYRVLYPLQLLASLPFNFLLRWCAFRGQRQSLTAFFISRPVITGAGTLLPDGTFALSEKGTGIRRLVRLSISPNDRPLFDTGNLIKAQYFAAMDLLLLRPGSLRRLFQRAQRLQLGISDSNRAQLAEYLKLGTTLLVLDAWEAGCLSKMARPVRPLRALRSLVGDSSLQAEIQLDTSETKNALRIQWDYLQAVRQYLRGSVHVPLEHHEILRLWEETLKLLEEDPGKLVGRLDWVSKRYLIETSGRDAPFEVKKKIDIGYHELGRGYFDALEREGIAPQLVTAEEARRAVTQPSSPARVRLRSRLVRGLAYEGERMSVSWSSVRIGNWWRRKIIHLHEAPRNEE